jgi:hypothetical protein
MKASPVVAAGLIFVAWAKAAPAYDVPARGTALRAAIMDALRPTAEAVYGPPVQFVVDDIRVAGSVAYASVRAQRPGGVGIVLEATPGFREGHLQHDFDWQVVQAILRGKGGKWSPVELVIMPSEAWWLDPELCTEFAAVLPSGCR